MEKEKIARINALAHKAKTSGLTETELAERDCLQFQRILQRSNRRERSFQRSCQ